MNLHTEVSQFSGSDGRKFPGTGGPAVVHLRVMDGPAFFGLCSRGAGIGSSGPKGNSNSAIAAFEFNDPEPRRAIQQGIRFADLLWIEDRVNP